MSQPLAAPPLAVVHERLTAAIAWTLRRFGYPTEALTVETVKTALMEGRLVEWTPNALILNTPDGGRLTLHPERTP